MKYQTKDLRIGNYMHDKIGRLCEVEKLSKDPDEVRISAINSAITSLPIRPIEITEAYLVLLGFKIIKGDWQYYKNMSALKVYARVNSRRLYFEIGGIYMGEIKYVHRLQNIWHSLSNGQELSI